MAMAYLRSRLLRPTLDDRHVAAIPLSADDRPRNKIGHSGRLRGKRLRRKIGLVQTPRAFAPDQPVISCQTLRLAAEGCHQRGARRPPGLRRSRCRLNKAIRCISLANFCRSHGGSRTLIVTLKRSPSRPGVVRRQFGQRKSQVRRGGDRIGGRSNPDRPPGPMRSGMRCAGESLCLVACGWVCVRHRLFGQNDRLRRRQSS